MNTDRKNSETAIEKILRNPSEFTPPTGLKERLVEEVQMPGSPLAPHPSITTRASGGWLRRWWPALAPAAVSVACAVVLTVRQGKIRELKTTNETLSHAAAAAEANAAQRSDAVNTTSADSTAEIQREIERLRGLATQLKTEIGQLQQLKTENGTLRSQVAAPPGLALTPQETEELAKAKEKAMSIACINNLKQFGLAVRVWALDNNDSNPPNVLSMSNELATPKVLFCPADTTRQAAPDWASFSMANCSYEFLAPSENTDADPQRVLSRCPIHGHIGLADGSVQSSIAKNHPEQLIERDGKLYFTTGSPPAQANGAQRLWLTKDQLEVYRKQYGLPRATEEQVGKYLQRYGVLQPGTTAPNPQPDTGTTNITEEQLKIFRERYGTVPTGGATPNQNP
jgi:hypothetical protein